MSQMPRQPEPELMDLDHEAQAYADADFRDVNARFVERLLELVPPHQPMRALDVGCGPGDIPIDVAGRCPGWSITAVDAADAMLRIARQRAARARVQNLRFVRDDAKTLASLDDGFDVIFSNSLLHHLPDPSGFWRQLKRLSRPGTVVFLRDLARPASVHDADRIVLQYAGNESATLQEEFRRSLLSAFTIDEARVQLDAANLHELQVDMSSDRHFDVWGVIRSTN